MDDLFWGKAKTACQCGVCNGKDKKNCSFHTSDGLTIESSTRYDVIELIKTGGGA